MGDDFYEKVKQARESINSPAPERLIEPLTFWIIFGVCVAAVIVLTLGWFL